MKYVYVTGGHLSGSTLLAFLLNAHPKIVSIGKLYKGRWPFQTFRCSCGSLLVECPFFLRLERRVREQGSSFSLDEWQLVFQVGGNGLLHSLLERSLRAPLFERIGEPLVSMWPGYARAMHAVGRRVYHLVRAGLEITEKQAFVDIEMDPARIKYLRAIPELDVRVIHLIRDVRGAVTSFLRRRAHGTRPVWGARSLEVARAASWWRNVNMSSDRARRFVSPDRWLRVRYDTLCANPQGTVDSIADFVGVERVPIPSNFYHTTHHIIGNRMRLGGPATSVVQVDDSWKTRLSERDLAVVARIAGSTSRHFGFAWP